MQLRQSTLVTLDTGVFPAAKLISEAVTKGFDLARVTVTDRELEGTDIRVEIVGLGLIRESAVWAESHWDKAVWASDESALREILKVISNGSFPLSRDNLTPGQRSQLRDAMILDAHVRQGRGVFVSTDTRAFVRHGRRERLEALYGIRILTKVEFEALVRGDAA